jgi:hypothetical protein
VTRIRTLTRPELTSALAVRQLLSERTRLRPGDAIRHLTPIQGQEPRAPYVALAARLDGFARDDLEASIAARGVVKSTLMRLTLHLAHGGDYPAYAQLARQARMRAWRKRFAHLDESRVAAELASWLAEPRTNEEIRERVRRYEGVPDTEWGPVMFARNLLPLVQPPPAGFWGVRRRPTFVVDPRPLPDPGLAATLVLRRYLAAFGPASLKDAAAWAGVAQGDFAPALTRMRTVTFRDERGTELLDLPRRPLPPGSTVLPVRMLARWDQPLLAFAERERIIPPELQPLQLGLSGDQTLTVDGRVAASWLLRRGRDVAQIAITPHVEVCRSARSEIRAEAKRAARFQEPDARRIEVAGV